MMYNWPPNTRAQQTLSGWCNSTLPFTYRPSRPSLFLLYGCGCRPTRSSAYLPLIFIKVARKYSREKKSSAIYFFSFLNKPNFIFPSGKYGWHPYFFLFFFLDPQSQGIKKYSSFTYQGDQHRSAVWHKKRQTYGINKLQSCYYIIALYGARCWQCWWEF